MIRVRELMNGTEIDIVKDKLSLSGHHIYGVFYSIEKEERFVQEYGNSILDLFIMKNSPYKSFGEYREKCFLRIPPVATSTELFTYPLLYRNEREFMILFEYFLNTLFKNENKHKNFFKRIRI